MPGRLEPEYIQDRMRQDFFPIAGDCYADAEKRSPGLQGKVVLRFAIVGDANTGGIVESADIMDRSTIRDPEMIECMRESMLSMSFHRPSKAASSRSRPHRLLAGRPRRRRPAVTSVPYELARRAGLPAPDRVRCILGELRAALWS